LHSRSRFVYFEPKNTVMTASFFFWRAIREWCIKVNNAQITPLGFNHQFLMASVVTVIPDASSHLRPKYYCSSRDQITY
jgi:hypothetical protein